MGNGLGEVLSLLFPNLNPVTSVFFVKIGAGEQVPVGISYIIMPNIVLQTEKVSHSLR
jgi:hypothetical protein